ncbi:hypothetical protein D3C72_2030160 [compost metagenome]
MPAVEHVVDHQQGVAGEIQCRVLRLLGKLCFRVQQGEVVGVALDQQVQPQRRRHAMHRHQPLGEQVGQWRATAADADHRHALPAAQQAGAVLGHVVEQHGQLCLVEQTGS